MEVQKTIQYPSPFLRSRWVIDMSIFCTLIKDAFVGGEKQKEKILLQFEDYMLD